MEKNFDRSSVCCCCWEYFGLRSKHLTLVNSAIEETIQTFIYPGYSVDVCSYPSMVCSGCRRNLYLLRAGKQGMGEKGWRVEEKVQRNGRKRLEGMKGEGCVDGTIRLEELEWLEGEGWRGWKEMDGEDVRRRMEGEGWMR